MRVFEVLTEAGDTPHIARSGSGWKVTFPDGSEVTATSREAANNLARQWSDANAPNNVRSRTRPDGRIEPTLSRSTSTDADTPRQSIEPGVRQGTPTSNQLTRAERRTLARTGRITRRGVTYTRRSISLADAEAERLKASNAARGISADDRGAASGNRNPTPDTPDAPKGWMSKFADVFLNSRFFKVIRAIFGATGATAINAAINASALEDTLDSFMRAVKDEANQTDEAGRQEFLRNISSGNFPPSVSRAYLESVERFNQLVVEGIISVILGGGWVAFVLLTGFSIGTGFVGAVLSLVAGGAFVVGGTMALYNLLESAGVIDIIENRITARVFNPQVVLGTAMTVDGYQEYFGESLDWFTAWTGWSAGDIVRDSVMYTETNGGAVTPQQATEIVKDFIKSDPKLLQAYNAGKEEAKEIMRSGAPEEESN